MANQTYAWRVKVERIRIARDCGDDACNCASHRKNDEWTFYPRGLVVFTDTGIRYEIKNNDLVTVLNEV